MTDLNLQMNPRGGLARKVSETLEQGEQRLITLLGMPGHALVVTPTRVILIRAGALERKCASFPLEQIDSVVASTGLIGGKIEVKSADQKEHVGFPRNGTKGMNGGFKEFEEAERQIKSLIVERKGLTGEEAAAQKLTEKDKDVAEIERQNALRESTIGGLSYDGRHPLYTKSDLVSLGATDSALVLYDPVYYTPLLTVPKADVLQIQYGEQIHAGDAAGGAIAGGLIAGGVGAIVGGVIGSGSASTKVINFAVKHGQIVAVFSLSGGKLRAKYGQIVALLDKEPTPAEPTAGAANAPQAQPTAQPLTLADLEKLADLRDKGIITPEEFEQKKRQILGV